MDPFPDQSKLICRVCKEASAHLLEIFQETDGDFEDPRIDEMLMACASVQVHRRDGLPAHICNKCFENVKFAYAIKQMIEKTHTELSIQKTLQNNENIGELFREIEESSSQLINERDNALNGVNELVKNCDFIQVDYKKPLILTCRQCLKAFTTIEGLKSHKRLHSGTLFNCKVCDKSYTRLNHLQRHEISHSNRKVYMCKICWKVLTCWDHLKKHLVPHLKDRPYVCKICRKGFCKIEHLNQHEGKCKGLKYFCDICNRGFAREDTMLIHKSRHENQEPILPTLENIKNFQEHFLDIDFDPKMEDFSEDESSEEEFAQESAEPAVFVRLESEPEVMAEAADTDEEYTPKRTKKRGRPRKTARKRGRPRKNIKKYNEHDYNASSLNKNNKKISCPICKTSFNSKSDLEVHCNELHKTNHGFPCTICHEVFASFAQFIGHGNCHELGKVGCGFCEEYFGTEDELLRHRKNLHESAKFSCKFCDKIFTKKSMLAKHLVNVHDGQNLQNSNAAEVKDELKNSVAACKICQKIYQNPVVLSEHEKYCRQKKSKKFLCSECGQRFIRNDYLIIHMRRHTGEKPFKCQYCGKGFPRTTDLTVHERYHTGEKTHLCMICGRGFSRAYNLTVHMRTHTGEKPYQCMYCDAAFAQGNDLKAHVRRHTGERFHCDLCSETFLMGYSLTQHKRNVHGLNVVSNIRRLQQDQKINSEDPPPITITLPPPVVPQKVFESLKTDTMNALNEINELTP